MSNSNCPIVSVVMITYGHENFIREAISGVLMQECSFEVELIIANDCSPDDTDIIVNDIRKCYDGPHKIHYHKHINNLGIMPNFIWAVKQSKGKYIALCEGDDYWTDPLKLQKQVDFLEHNTDFFMVGHQSQKIINIIDGSDTEIIGIFKKDVFDYDDLAIKNIRIPTASLVFKNKIKFPEWFFKVYGGDRALIYLASTKGKIKVMDFIGSVYRIHDGGIEQGYKKDKSSLPKRNIHENNIYLSIIPKKYTFKYLKANSWNYFYLSINYLREFKISNSFKSFYKSILYYIKYLWSLQYLGKINN
ncbi:glycosyltransferase family 2 protein [Flavobacterium sangjuense]|uniref:Glycosyltransferase 2-like domain-containing protein n=1 Tax=Flavobacterium sangjuense TaxID=2518177 RepID=A0A4P7PSG8_9FLAO|nr:glycosyltransferase [Flavobacterium sangjuense]QBZ97868.1 hypothetical protein GS03_01366 [Flavobacterium sangjuense]